MRNKKWLLCFLSLIIIFSSLFSSDVYAKKDEDNDNGDLLALIGADDEFLELFFGLYFSLGGDIDFKPSDYMDRPNAHQDTEETGGIPLEIKKYNIARYTVNNEDTSGLIVGNLNSLSNALMSVIQHIVLITDSSFEFLFSVDLLNEVADTLQTVTDTIYETLKDYFAEILMIVFLAYLFYLYAAKGSLQAMLKKILMFVVILVVGGYWIANSGTLLKTFNGWSEEGQGFLVEAGNGMLNFFENEGKKGVYAQIDDINEDEILDGTMAVMRNVYFDLALKRPYLMINYNQTDESKINAKDNIGGKFGFGFDNYNRVDRMLAFKTTYEGMGYRSVYARAEATHENNNNMTAGGAFKQFGLVFLTLITTLFISIPFALIPALSFILQLLMIVITFVFPFALIISYLPWFSNTFFKAFGKLFGVFVLNVLLGVFILFLYMIAFLTNQMIPPDTIGKYFLNIIVLSVLMLYLVIKRDALISFVTAGYVASLDKNILSNVNQGMNKVKTDIQGASGNAKTRFAPSIKPMKPISAIKDKFGKVENHAPEGDGKTKGIKQDKENGTKRTQQVKNGKNTRSERIRKGNPIARTKQLLFARKEENKDVKGEIDEKKPMLQKHENNFALKDAKRRKQSDFNSGNGRWVKEKSNSIRNNMKFDGARKTMPIIRKRQVESVEEKKKDRNIDKGLS